MPTAACMWSLYPANDAGRLTGAPAAGRTAHASPQVRQQQLEEREGQVLALVGGGHLRGSSIWEGEDRPVNFDSNRTKVPLNCSDTGKWHENHVVLACCWAARRLQSLHAGSAIASAETHQVAVNHCGPECLQRRSWRAGGRLGAGVALLLQLVRLQSNCIRQGSWRFSGAWS